MRTHKHTHTHTYIYIYIYTYIHTYTCAYTQWHTSSHRPWSTSRRVVAVSVTIRHAPSCRPCTALRNVGPTEWRQKKSERIILASSLNFRKPSPSLTGAGQRAHAQLRARNRAKEASTHDLFTKSCLKPTETAGANKRPKAACSPAQPVVPAQIAEAKIQQGGQNFKAKISNEDPPEAAMHPRTHSAPGHTCQAKAVPPRRISWLPLHAKLVCRILRETETEETWEYSKYVLFGHCLPVHSPGLWNLEQLVPSTPNPLLPENGAALVAQLARASAR